MKKILAWLLAAAVIGGGSAQAQNLLMNGDFSNGSTNWTTFNPGTGAEATYDFAANTDLPTGATGNGLSFSLTGDGSAGGIFQAVTLQPNSVYAIDGLGNDPTASSGNSWLEVHITATMPVSGTDVTVAGGSISATTVNNWGCAGYDGAFTGCNQTPGFAGGSRAGYIQTPDDAVTDYYFVLKTGNCCGAGAGQVWTADDLSLTLVTADVDGPGIDLDGSFDAVNVGTGDNNWGGSTNPASGDGNIIQEFTDTSGSTGGAGDYAWRLHDNGALSGNWQNGGFDLSANRGVGRDVTSYDQLTFDARVGTGAWTDWDIRIEDKLDTTGGEYNNDRASFTFTESWDSYTIPFADLQDGVDRTGAGRPVVTLSATSVIVWEANGADGSAPVDLYLDNITFSNSASSVHEWSMY